MKPTNLKCYPQVVAVIGEALADYELQRVIDCPECSKDTDYHMGFYVTRSPQKSYFWSLINKGQNPYEHGHEKPEVKEWAYIDHTVAGDSKITQWCEIKDKHYMGLNLMVLHESKDVEVFATHKSVIMPDWVPADLDKLDYNPEDVAFSARLPQEDKRTAGIHANTEIFVPESESGDKEYSDKDKEVFQMAQDAMNPQLINNPTAASILEAGLGHMKDRAVTYNSPQGERSMGKTVEMFNIMYGLELTEEQGWAFMELLKLVRSSQGDFKLDNYEDMAAYAGLMGEAAFKLASASE